MAYSPAMRAVVCRVLGPLAEIAVEEWPDPEPAAGHVVVDVKAAGVNYVDGLMCQGRYQMRPDVPYVPGGEVSGVVSAVGEGVIGFGVGDRVLALTGFGAFAERVAVAAPAVMLIPADLDFDTAATFVQSYSTALFALRRRTTVNPGEWVLVLGAGGGIGLAAVDVAVAFGAHVIAAASTAEKLAAATALGAEATIAYESEDLKQRARQLSGGGVDVVVDPVGGAHSEPALRATRPFGRLCVIGFTSGVIPTVPLNQVLLTNRSVVGVDWGSWAFRDRKGNRALLEELVELVRTGRLHPTRPRRHPLEEAAVVMAGLIDRSVGGKIVLIP